MERKVVVESCGCFEYPGRTAMFRPDKAYPEYMFKEHLSDGENKVYECVRNALARMGYDKERFGTPEWNPLSDVIKEGDTVLIKPNLVEEINRSGETFECMYTQPGVIAPVIDYTLLALKGNGKIIVADAPMQDCDFDKLIEQCGLNELINFYKQYSEVNVELRDLRAVITKNVNGIPHYTNIDKSSVQVDLGSESEFHTLTKEQILRLRKGANDVNDLRAHHNMLKHEYDICTELLEADVLIDMPKPKLHKKAGVTISLKNMVGVNVRKEYLPHFTEGDGQTGKGDAYEYKDFWKSKRNWANGYACAYATKEHFFVAKIMTIVRRFFGLGVRLFSKNKDNEGTWRGNHTVSKMVVDINKIVKYADKSGKLCDKQKRKRIIIADMIISGEKAGPVAPSPKNVGIIAVGEDPVCFDECIATLMGAKIEQIPTLVNAREVINQYPLVEKSDYGRIFSNIEKWDRKLYTEILPEDTLKYKPVESWKSVFYQ